jgi:pimeloyl-ACP methyl ester carboxylesterase
MESIAILDSHDNQLSASYTAVSNKDKVIIIVPGFTGYKDESNWPILAQELSQVGVASIVFDPRGFGTSSGNLEHDYRLSNTIEDVDTVYHWLIEHEGYDPTGIYLLGSSQGAAIVLIKAAQNPGRYRAVIAISPPNQFAHGDVMERYLADWQASGYYKKRSSKYGELQIPYQYYLDAAKWKTVDYAKNINDPVLIIVGDKDDIVPNEISHEVYQVINTSTKSYLTIDGMGHFFKHDTNKMLELHKVVIQYIKTL